MSLSILLLAITMSSKTKCAYTFLPAYSLKSCTENVPALLLLQLLRRPPQKNQDSFTESWSFHCAVSRYNLSYAPRSSPEIVEIQSPVKKTGTLPKKGQSDQTFVTIHFVCDLLISRTCSTTPVKQTVKTPAKRDSNKSFVLIQVISLFSLNACSASPAKQKVSDSAKVPGSAKGEPMQRCVCRLLCSSETNNLLGRLYKIRPLGMHSFVDTLLICMFTYLFSGHPRREFYLSGRN